MSVNKIKAFSLIELLIVMMISGITISMTFTCYSIIRQQFSKYKKESIVVMETVDLEKTLSLDFYKGKLVQRIENGFMIDRRDYKVSYEYFGKKLLRTMPMRTDTFQIDVKFIEVKMENVVVESDDYIDEVLIVCGEEDNAKTYHHHIWYSAEDYMTMKQNKKSEDYVWSRPQ